MRSEKPENYQPGSKRVFVFGSNEAGRHGAGAAKFAAQYCGARYGQGEGLQGNSYAIPTKDAKLNTHDLDTIRNYIRRFFVFAKEHPELEFDLTPIGTGLAGYSKTEDIYPIVYKYWTMFDVGNIRLTDSWYE